MSGPTSGRSCHDSWVTTQKTAALPSRRSQRLKSSLADYYFLCGGHQPENLTPEGEHALLLSWVLIGTAYPVLERMDRVDDPDTTRS